MFADYQEEVDFLRKHTAVVELVAGDKRVAVVPAWQGRVMTSTAAGLKGASFGWINPPVIETGVRPEAERADLAKHIHIFGGEERLWLGPEGGPNSLFFQPGAEQVFANWKTPAVIDTQPFEVVGKATEKEVTFGKSFEIKNRAGTTLSIGLQRKVRLLNAPDITEMFETCFPASLKVVGYMTENEITNNGKEAWTRKTGAPSVWLLGMYKPSPKTTVVIPYEEGSVEKLGKIAETSYFGAIPEDRICYKNSAVFFKGDGTQRGKLGVGPKRSKGIAGSWQADLNTLTLVMIVSKESAANKKWPYVDSQWKDDVDPFGGDVINSYNDGPPEPGAKPLGPFYELETSSPALFLGPQESYLHSQVTLHLTGDRDALDAIAIQMLGANLTSIEGALP